ncbi:DUF6077 domain-containing protein [Lachnotalea glycerini]|uniref:Uncharacterized protein n=1 Tax=Lachnotalea glycerini TaxID=1763509 RepID=A0A371JD08_9FIRM|nr:DUF6077 domain-containing protein [Lachnotalea glycerini]RDY30547.1 hypothetical protein CG710_014165 [Lachnotalea glycerini]
MGIISNICSVIFWNLIIPTFIGFLVTHFWKKEDKDNIVLNFAIGLITVLGIFQPITLSAIYLKLSFTLLANIMKILWLLLSLVSLVINWKRFINCFRKLLSIFKSFHIFTALVLLLIILQIFAYVEYEHIDDDDSFFVATATTTIVNDNLYIRSPFSGVLYGKLPTRYIMSPFSIFYAVMARLTGIHATIFTHLYLTIILLIFVYAVYYLWGKALFDNSRSLSIFLFLIAMLNLFGNYSEFTTQSFLLLRIWQGKAILAAGIIPFILYLCYCIYKEDSQVILWCVLFLSTSAASHVSSMGIFLAPVSVGCFAAVELIRTRKWKRTLAYLFCCLPCVVCGVIYLIIS